MTKQSAGGDFELKDGYVSTSILSSPRIFYTNIMQNRNMIANFIRRDVRIRYRNSLLGYIWTVLQPLLLACVYYFVFTIIANQSERLYPIWVLIAHQARGLGDGRTPWGWAP